MKLKFKKTEVDYSVGDTAAAQKKKPSTPIRNGTYDLVVTSSDVLPISYMRLMGAKVTKLGSCDKHIGAMSSTGHEIQSFFTSYLVLHFSEVWKVGKVRQSKDIVALFPQVMNPLSFFT